LGCGAQERRTEDFVVATSSSVHDWGPAVRQGHRSNIYVRAIVDESAQGITTAGLGGKGERCHPSLVLRVDVNACVQEYEHRLGVVPEGRHMQCRSSKDIARVQGKAFTNEPATFVRVAHSRRLTKLRTLN
jgi:hypothetical protein